MLSRAATTPQETVIELQTVPSRDLKSAFDTLAWKHADPPDAKWVEFADLIAAHYSPPATGRHSILANKEIISRLLTFLERGDYAETACYRAGTNPVTLSTLLKRGEAGEEPFNAFLWAVKTAEGNSESEAVHLVRDAGKDPRFWAAAMTWLERRFPDRYARRNEDSSQPKVIVQIGVNDSDVQVHVHAGSPTLPVESVSMSLLTPIQGEAVSD